MNHIILLGRLTKETELNTSGKIATNSIAVDRRLKDANGNKVTDFINLRWLGESKARFAKEYLTKGVKVCIEGNLCIDQYKDSNGNPKSAVYVLVDNTEFAESKKTQEAAPPVPAATTDADGFMNIPDGIDEELPFN